MIMLEKMIKLLKMIKDLLWYNTGEDNIVVIPKDDFIKNDLSIEDVKIGLQTLIDKEIIKNCYIEDRIGHAYPTDYEEKKDYIKDSIPLSGIFSEEVLGTPLYFIEIRDKNKLIEFIQKIEKSNIPQGKRKIEFDSQNGIITCGKEQYKILSDIKLALMRKLWDEREEIKINQDGKEEMVHKGTRWSKESIARNIEKDPKLTYQAIKDLNGIFRRRDFPLKITTAGGVLLVVKV